MVKEPLNFELGLLVEEFKSSLNKAKQSIKSLNDDAIKTNQKIEASSKKLIKSYGALAGAATAAFLAIKKGFEFIKFGAQVRQQEEAFRNLAMSVGASSEQIIRDLRRMSGESISRLDAVSAASRAIILGIDPSKLGRLMEISRASARAFGTEVTFMFDSITLGIGRQSKMILDNLGIIVSAEQAYSNYAAELDTTVERLTETQKKEAFLNATLEAGQRILDQVNVKTKTQLENLKSLEAFAENIKVKAAQAMLFVVQAGSAIINVLRTVQANSMIGIANVVEFMLQSTLKAVTAIDDMASKLPLIENPLKGVRDGLEKNVELTEAWIESFKQAPDDFATAAVEITNLMNGSVQPSLVRMKETIEQAREQQKLMSEDMQTFADLAGVVSDQNRLNFETQMQGNIMLLNQFKDAWMTGHANMAAFASNVIGNFRSSFGSAISDIITGTKSAKEAFKEFGKQMIKSIVDYIVQQGIAFAISEAMKKVVAKTTAVMAAELANAWAPAAALASLATLGGNAAPATAGMATTVAAAFGMANLRKAQFGMDDVISKPTTILAGEGNRQERVTVQPITAGTIDGGGGEGGVNININGNFRGDPAMIAQELGDVIEAELRYSRGI